MIGSMRGKHILPVDSVNRMYLSTRNASEENRFGIQSDHQSQTSTYPKSEPIQHHKTETEGTFGHLEDSSTESLTESVLEIGKTVILSGGICRSVNRK